MSEVPLPLRVAAGVLVTTIEAVRKLPEQIVSLPVTAASKAVQTGMRAQQHVTHLAIRGDEVFALLSPPQDSPPWARFDEDETDIDPVDRNGSLATVRPVPGADEVWLDDDGDVEEPGHAEAADAGPAALPGYDGLSLPQLRAKLRTLSVDQLTELLEHERTHGNRAPFLTMLSNRISTVRST